MFVLIPSFACIDMRIQTSNMRVLYTHLVSWGADAHASH